MSLMPRSLCHASGRATCRLNAVTIRPALPSASQRIAGSSAVSGPGLGKRGDGSKVEALRRVALMDEQGSERGGTRKLIRANVSLSTPCR